MKRNLWILALACLLLPGLLTYFWFYTGSPHTSSPSMPDYSSIDFPRPNLSTEIPIAQPPEKTKVNILFDLQHQNQYSISEIDPLVRFIESYGGSILTTSEQVLPETSLKSADVYVCIAPLLRFTPQEITEIRDFVRRGGKLVVFTDPTRNAMMTMPVGDSGGAAAPNTVMSGTDAANLLLEPFDISFTDDYLYNLTENEGNFRNVIINDLANDDLTAGVKQLVVYGGHSVHSSGSHLAKTGHNTLSSNSDLNETYSLADLVKYGSGHVLAVGDLSLITTQFAQSSDNQVFTQNLAKFLTSAPREKTLVDFPAIFTGPVTLQPAGKIAVDGELVSAASNLEKYLQIPDGGFSISKKSDGSTDLILLSTFESSDANKDILDELKINLSPEVEEVVQETSTPEPDITRSSKAAPEMQGEEPKLNATPTAVDDEPESGPGIIEAPYFNQIKTADLGLVALSHSDGKNTLVIMASSPKKVQTFIRNLAISGLTGCIVHADLAACKVTDFTVPPQG
jgi:hypothetical protein